MCRKCRNAVILICFLWCGGSCWEQPTLASTESSVELPDGTTKQSLTLSAGWNLIALPVQPVNSNVREVLKSIAGSYESVWTYQDGAWLIHTPRMNSTAGLKTMDAGHGYWIKMIEPATLELEGAPPLNAANHHEGIALNPGWNLIGYSSSFSSAIGDSLQPIEGNYQQVWAYESGQWRIHRPGKARHGGLATLEPGRGYWILADRPCSWLARNYLGTVVDIQSGEPIPGCAVSLDGIEAEALTDATGAFSIYGITEARDQLLTVIAPGYEPFSMMIDSTRSELASASPPLAPASVPLKTAQLQPSQSSDSVVIKLDPLPAPAIMDIISPVEGAHYVAPEGADSITINVEGYASLQSLTSFRFDVVFVIDTSGSTAALTGTDLDHNGIEDTVLDVELFACRQLIRSLLAENTRFGVIKYGRYYSKNAPDGQSSTGSILTSQTRVVQDITSDRSAVEQGLNLIASEGSTGGTHTAKGIELAINVLNQAPPVNADTGNAPRKHIILLTDGIPTLPIEPGETQERKDRLATLDTAKEAKRAGVAIHPVVIDPIRARDRKLTTMPSVAAVNGVSGSLLRANLNNINNLPRMLESIPFTGISAILLKDENTGQIWDIQPRADGGFQREIPAPIGSHRWTFQFSTGGKNQSQKTISFVVDPHDTPGILGQLPLVATLDHLNSPAGEPLSGGLLNWLKANFPQARLLPNHQLLGALANDLTLEVLSQKPGQSGDVGLFACDANNPPSDTTTWLNSLNNANVVISVQSSGKPGSTVTSGHWSVSAGSGVGLFFVPKGTLQNAKTGKAAALVSVAALNPGHFAQSLLFFDDATKKVICAFEDTEVLSKRANQDFEDLILAVSPGEPAL